MGLPDRAKDLAGQAMDKARGLDEQGKLDGVKAKAEEVAEKVVDAGERKTGRQAPDAVDHHVDQIDGRPG